MCSCLKSALPDVRAILFRADPFSVSEGDFTLRVSTLSVGTNCFANPFEDMAVILLVFPLEVKGGRMKWTFPISVAILLSVGITACSPKLPADQENTPASQPTLTETYYPLTTRTGIEEIDRILDASGDVQKLRSLIQFTSTKCTKRDGLGGPPKCLPNEGEGTPVEVLPFLGPEGYFFRRNEIEKWQICFRLIAIYENSRSYSDENYPAGQYAILFVGRENQPAISLRVRNGRIVRVDSLFDNSPESLDGILQREAAKLILAPVTR
jgi:hypothetical protein